MFLALIKIEFSFGLSDIELFSQCSFEHFHSDCIIMTMGCVFEADRACRSCS